MSDRIAVILEGRIEQLGTPSEIYDHPATAFVAGFVGQQNFLVGTIQGDGVVITDSCSVKSAVSVDTLAPGARALAAIRPEYVQVGLSDPGQALNAVRGTLVGVSHLGELMQYVTRTEGRQELISRRPRRETDALAVGDRVWCSWSPEHVRLFSDVQATRVLTHPATAAARPAKLETIGVHP